MSNSLAELFAKYSIKVYIVILCILVVYSIYLFLYYSFDKGLKKRNEKLAHELANNKLESLINGSGINNIPNLNIVSNNPGILKAASCAEGPVHVGDQATDQDCIRTCANSTASAINVNEGETYIYRHAQLKPGAHCVLGPRPQCNMRTTYAFMTLNSVVCHPKFPEVVGGPLGNKVVACNNDEINDPQNYLWDYRENVRFNPTLHQINDVDERLSSTGDFRYRCRFNGFDETRNKYIQHPNNRFHPFRNYCASQVFAAHPSVKPKYIESTGLYECDCGPIEETRIANIDPTKKSSICSNLQKTYTNDTKNRITLTLPYRCFTLFSPFTDVGRYLPCPNEQFTREGSQFTSIDVPYSTHLDDPIENPMYKEFKEGVHIGEGYIPLESDS